MRRPVVLVLSCFVAVIGCAGCSTSAAVVDAGSTPSVTAAAELPVVVLGDSYTVDSAEGAGYVPPVAEAMGWAPVLEAGDGTGYLAPGRTTDPSPYGERLDAVVAAQPDLVLVQGSTNDVGWSSAELGEAATQLYAALAARLPAARVVVLGPLSPPGVDPGGVAAVRDVLAQVVDASGLTFIDPVAEGWLVPSDGLFADPVHPNEEGYRVMAAQLVTALRAEGL
ncbi:SGNH/GDSL hydrolase family protein [Modestobacter lacusdianchii]